MMNPHVLDDLELYVLGALPEPDAARVGEHLRTCAECRTSAAGLAEVVSALPETVLPREPRAGLRDRILSDARATLPARPVSSRPFWAPARLRSSGLVFGALAAAVLLLSAISFNEYRQLQVTQAEKENYQKVSSTGRSWYMKGGGDWKGSGGTLVAAQDGSAYVLFHDLQPVPENARYAVWLITPSGRWVRGVDFQPDGSKLQTVPIAADASAFDRCLVTLEVPDGPKPRGPVVMQYPMPPAPQEK